MPSGWRILTSWWLADLDQLVAGGWWLVPSGWRIWNRSSSSSSIDQRLAAGGWRILTSGWRLADQSRGKILTDPASYTIDQLGGTLAAA